MTQDELKKLVAEAAVKEVEPGAILGVGTGSTVDLFIDALHASGVAVTKCVSSSERTTAKLMALGYTVVDLNDVQALSVYIDGADEINADFDMIKGGGGALTREKIVASVADRFVCIADASKKVDVLGRFPLPVEVIPMAVEAVARQLRAFGGEPKLRDMVTDNGNRILDVHGLQITNPKALEAQINAIPGVVTVGLFAARGADVLLLGTEAGVVRTER